MKTQLKRYGHFFAAVAALVALTMPAFIGTANALPNTQITLRKLQLVAGATDGGSAPGGTVNHRFEFTLNNTTEDLGSITFQYCTTAAPSGATGCIAPAGIDVTNAALVADTGVGSFVTLDTSSVCDSACGLENTITIGRASAADLSSATAVVKEFSNIDNPSTEGTFFVRISTRTSLDGSGPTANDTGTVAASTAEPINLTGTMPESLIFCTGQAISETANVPDCTTATSGNISFNQLFSPSSTSYSSSQMAASTNAGDGYVITVNGPTLTSGGNTITGISAGGGAVSALGTSQFGLNLALDAEANGATPAISPISAIPTEPTGASNYTGRALPPYDTGDPTDDTTYLATYKFVSGDIVADSNSDASDGQVFTVTYLANVPGSQPAGTYSTTLTYICTPTF